MDELVRNLKEAYVLIPKRELVSASKLISSHSLSYTKSKKFDSDCDSDSLPLSSGNMRSSRKCKQSTNYRESSSSDSDQSKENLRRSMRRRTKTNEAEIVALLAKSALDSSSDEDSMWERATPSPSRVSLRNARRSLSYNVTPSKTPSRKTEEPKVSPIKIRRKAPLADTNELNGASERSLRNRSTLKRPIWLDEDLEIYKSPKSKTALSPRTVPTTPKTPKSLRQQVLEANTPVSVKRVLRTPESQKRSSRRAQRDDEVFKTPDSSCSTPRRSQKARDSVPSTPTSSVRKKILATPTKATPSTPSSVKRAGRGFLTPVVGERSKRLLGTPSSEIDLVRAQLHVSTVPNSLPCREKEFKTVHTFLSRKIEEESGGCMYISGVPGTGKTASVHAVVRDLQEQSDKKKIPPFDFVEVNGLRLTEPRQAYVRILQSLTGQKAPSEQAHRSLDNKFNGKNKRSTVLLVDELDYLCNKRQDVIYNILDWSTKITSKLVVLTIANTMDLPERTLKGKVTSRMGLTRLVFQPYGYQELQQIVRNRLVGTTTFHPDAIQLVSRKVAAVSGDARRALDICRRTTELIKEGEVVTVEHVEKALTQIFSGTRVLAIKNCSVMAQLVLRAIRDETQRTGVEETNVANIYSHLLSICALEGLDNPSSGDVLNLCTKLSMSGLIVAEKNRLDMNRKLSLNVSSDDIHYALNC